MIDVNKKIVFPDFDYEYRLLNQAVDGMIFGEYRYDENCDWKSCLHSRDGHVYSGVKKDWVIVNTPDRREYNLRVNSNGNAKKKDTPASDSAMHNDVYTTGNLKITEELIDGKWKVTSAEVIND